MKWLILLVALSLPSSMAKADLKAPPPSDFKPPKKVYKPYKPPEHPFIKFITKDIWAIHKMSKQCIEGDNKSLCANAQSIYPEQMVFVVFKWKF